MANGRGMGARGLIAAALLSMVMTPLGSAEPSMAAGSACAWRAGVLPIPEGTDSGGVLGSDGGDRWVGFVESGAALWAHGVLTELGPGRAEAVNRHGVVVGGADAHAVMWVSGRRIALAEPTGVTRSRATAVNASGVIVGWGVRGNEEDSEGPSVGLVWSVDTPARVVQVRYRELDVVLTGVTDAGVLVGIGAQPRTEEGPRTALRGTLRSGLRPLDPAAASSAAYAAAGRYVVGETTTGGALWNVRTGSLLASRAGLLPTAVNRHGMVAALNRDPLRPVVWTRTGVTVLPVPSGWSSASTDAINDGGDIGGALNSVGPSRPVLWTCSAEENRWMARTITTAPNSTR